jgi:tetratricopeptide (TPR) repeat protein
VYHRTKERRDAGAALRIAWLPEDPWTIASYRHLLAAVAARLEPSPGGDLPRSTEELEALLSSGATQDGPIVVLVENLDQIFTALGNEGQQRLRHFLQSDRSLLLVATTTRLDRSLSDQASPFYGFFTTTRLDPFDVDEAAAMLTAIAEERGDAKLVTYLAGDEGRARLRTITHLAGGQPRMWAALASALTVGGLEDLIELLLTRFDDLTPYYQEQLARLSPRQRLVVAELAEVDRPVNVSEMAERLQIDQRSLGKTMSELVERGWAAPTGSRVAELLDKRRTYYELAEPLARLSFQIKESRGEPLRLVVEFLKYWFDPDALSESQAPGGAAEYVLLATAGQEGDPVLAVTRRLQRLPLTRVPTVSLLGQVDDALAALMDGNPEPFIRLPAPVRAALEDQLDTLGPLGVRSDIHNAAASEFGRTRHPEMTRWIIRAEDLIAGSPGPEKPNGQLLLAGWLGRAWRFDEATEVLAAVTSALGEEEPRTLTARSNLAASYWQAGRTDEAIQLQETVLSDSQRILGPDHPDTLTARSNLAASYWQAGRTDEAIQLGEAVLTDRQRILGAYHPDTLTARSILGLSYWQAGRTDEAIQLQESVLSDSQRILGPDHPDTLTARSNLAASYSHAGRTDEAIQLQETVLDDRQRILGPDHPNTLTARSNLAVSYWQAGRTDEAIQLQETVLSDSQRILGPDHPNTLTARSNLAASYSHAGRTDEAIQLQETVLDDRQRILGPAHPDTITARSSLATSYRSAGRDQEADALENA